MPKSLLEQLPEIVRAGRRQAEGILEQLDGPSRVTLQTREFVVPNRASGGLDLGGLTDDADTAHPSRLIYGDNLLAMAALLADDSATPSLRGRVDLVYIDPPFDSKADYRQNIHLPGADIDQRPTIAEQFAYSDAWANGTASYLEMLVPRLVLMRELLTNRGSLVVHLDWHVGHYVKIALDDIFGRSNFRDEIVWHYPDKLQGNIRALPKNHDVIFRYSKTDDYIWNGVKIPLEKTRRINRRVWNPTTQRLDTAKDAQGRVIYDEYDEKNADDVWQVPQAEVTKNPRRTGYATEKPLTLLTRIITATTEPGSIVCDFFVGSGTTPIAAEQAGRRWIVSDLGKPATMITRKRLVDINARPFLYQAIGDYQVEQARSTLGRRFRVGDLAQTVMGIYGALPLPPEESEGGVLGRMPQESTLVLVDSPSRLTTRSTLERAQRLRESKLGGFEKVVILGWNFAAGIAQTVAAMKDPALEVRMIPANLLDELKKKGFDRLSAQGSFRFATLQYLDAHIDSTAEFGDAVELRIQLDNYVLLDPNALPLSDGDRDRVIEVMEREPLALIEYWAVDPDFDGETFRSTWQDYRENTADDGDPLRTVTSANVITPRRPGPRRVCVRAVDVFGFESEVVLEAESTV